MTELKVGRTAPDFCLKDQDEKDVCLKDFKGKFVVLYFYPKDNTPGCTIEAIDFSKLKQDFSEVNAIVLGISKDSCLSHQKFRKLQNLTVNLLSDPDVVLQKKYGVWKPKKFMGKEFLGTKRTTFLIDTKGKLVQIWSNVSVNGHAEDVLSTIKKLL